MVRHGIVRTAALTTAVSQIVVPAQKRISLTFTAGSGDYTVNTESGIVLGSGLTVAAGSNALVLTQETHGDLVTKAFYAIGSASFTIGYVEAYEE